MQEFGPSVIERAFRMAESADQIVSFVNFPKEEALEPGYTFNINIKKNKTIRIHLSNPKDRIDYLLG